MKYILSVLAIVLCLGMATNVFADELEKIVFTGIPTYKISEGGLSRVPEKLSEESSFKYKCTITKLNNKYYWTTRENVELMPVESGAYITYIAINGSGYVRIIQKNMKDVVALLDDTEKEFDYVEHLLLGLKSITYYGEKH